MLDVIGDLAFNQSFHQLESGEEHQYVIDFNNGFMLIGLVCIMLAGCALLRFNGHFSMPF